MTQFDLFTPSLSVNEKFNTGVPDRPADGITYGVDYGKRKWHVGRSDCDRVLTLDDCKFLSGDYLKEGDRVVIEVAHATPKKSLVSKAQPLTYERLKTLKANYESKGVEIRLFPHSQTGKYRCTFFPEYCDSKKKTDAIDAQSIAKAADQIGFINLQAFDPRPANGWGSLELYCFEAKAEMTAMCNLYRDDCGSTDSLGVYSFSIFRGEILSILYSKNSYAVEDFFSGRSYSKGECSPSIALWSAVVRWDGSIRKWKGKPLGVNTMMRYLLGNKPNSFRGGVARSNIWYYNFPQKRFSKALKDKNSSIPVRRETSDQLYQIFQQAKREYRREMKDVLQAMQQVALRHSGSNAKLP